MPCLNSLVGSTDKQSAATVLRIYNSTFVPQKSSAVTTAETRKNVVVLDDNQSKTDIVSHAFVLSNYMYSIHGRISALMLDLLKWTHP